MMITITILIMIIMIPIISSTIIITKLIKQHNTMPGNGAT